MTKPKPPKEVWAAVPRHWTGCVADMVFRFTELGAKSIANETWPHGNSVYAFILAPAKPKRSKRGGKK